MSKLDRPVLVASLILSILLWLVVYAQNMKPLTPVRYAVKLTEEGLDGGRLIVTKVDDLFRFTASGPEEKLRELRNDSIAAVVDLSSAQPGRRRYPVQIYPESIREYVMNKSLTALVEIEPIEERKLAVTVEGAGQLKDARYMLTDTLVEPKEVTARGAKSLVDRASLARVRLDLGAIDSGASAPITLGVEILDRSGRPLDVLLVRSAPLFVNVTPTLSLAPEEKTMLVVPRFRGQVAPGYLAASYRCEPQQVIVRGSSLALAALSKIQTEIVDVTGLSATTIIPAKLVVPTGLSVAGGRTTVNFTLTVIPSPVDSLPISPPPTDGTEVKTP